MNGGNGARGLGGPGGGAMNGGGGGPEGSGGSGGGPARKRSRTSNGGTLTPPFRSSTPRNAGGSGSGGTANDKFMLDKNERLLRLNVGGRPYDVVRTSMPLLETMMTDRWLSSCLVDGDGRIFIDRDGDAFGDVLRYLRGGADFLLELVRSSGSDGLGLGGLGGAAVRAGGSPPAISGANRDRLRRLRTEADYYGLHQLVHDIDVVTIGEKCVFEELSWARVSGGCLPRNQRIRMGIQAQDNDQNGNAGGAGGGDDVQNENAGGQQMNGGGNEQNQEAAQQDEDNDNADEDQAMEEDDEEEDADPDAEEEEEDEQQEFVVEEEEEDGDPNQPPPYRHWTWSKQDGNPSILKPHPTHTSSMVVGQDGSYLLLLRLAAALPSPLARIKWDQEDQGRTTRSASRARRRPSNLDTSDEEELDELAGDSPGRSKELEEDYFATVHIEAPLQTVMDSVDESQTHFPLIRCGLWDYRTEDDQQNDDPVFATFCAMDVVALRAGDILSVSFMNDDVSRERNPFPDDMPPDLVNSLTLVRVYGNTLARYERLKSCPFDPTEQMQQMTPRPGSSAGGGGGLLRSPARSPQRRRRQLFSGGDGNHSDDGVPDNDSHSHFDPEAEDRSRSLMRTAHWASPRNDFPPTPFHPALRSKGSVIEFPHPGRYLLLGRVALGCRRDASFRSVLSGGPVEGHRAQMSVRSAGGRLLHAVGIVFEERPKLEISDLSELSENACLNDVVDVPQLGTELCISTTGDCRLHPEGTEVGPFCSAVSQSLSCLLLDDDVMEVDRYNLGTVRNASLNQREIKWFHTRSASAPPSQGRGGTSTKPSLFDVDGHRLIWRGILNYCLNGSNNRPASSTSTVLVVGSIPPLHRGYVLGLLKNGEPVSISITPESMDEKGRHCHNFHEVIELREGDELTVAQLSYGGDDGSWRDQLQTENRLVELDTRIGHLSFIVLQGAEVDN
ncbi:hypothetical protein ACHAXT_005928 [Thalassiosira profunda]